MKPLSDVWDRVYSDFVHPSRLAVYQRLLEAALQADYRVTTVGGLWGRIQSGGLEPGGRYFVLRHDVDTDPGTAAAMWAIDRQLGIDTSYFFRLSTLAPELMAEIGSAGSEASYHYEEVATVAKRLQLRTRSEAMEHLPEAKDRFAENLARLRAATGLGMTVVASHGDFVNRHVGVPNWEILRDLEFRQRMDIELETYDEALLRHLPSRQADGPHPRHWDPSDPAAAIRAGEPVISVLVHPRHWRVNRVVNARDDIGRVVEGVRFALPR